MTTELEDETFQSNIITKMMRKKVEKETVREREIQEKMSSKAETEGN